MKNIKYAIEGILFAAGEPVGAAKLAAVLDAEIDGVEKAVAQLKDEYSSDERGFDIIDIRDGYQICSSPLYYTYIREILGEQRNQPLSNAAGRPVLYRTTDTFLRCFGLSSPEELPYVDLSRLDDDARGEQSELPMENGEAAAE